MFSKLTHLRVKKTYLLLLMLLLFMFCSRGMALQVYREAVVKSAILYNIIKFVEWPEGAFEGPESPLKICVFGENLLQKELLKWAESDFYGRPIEIEVVTDIAALKERAVSSHLLYVAAERRAHAAEIIELLGSRPVLTVSDYGEFILEGGIISLTEIDGKTHFSLNLDSAACCQLRISAKLAQLSHTLIKNGRNIEGRQ